MDKSYQLIILKLLLSMEELDSDNEYFTHKIIIIDDNI